MKQLFHENHDKSIELLDSILDSSTEYALIATDPEGRIIMWNKGAQIIYGYSSEEMLGQQALSSLHRKEAYDVDILFVSENNAKHLYKEHSMNALRKDGSTCPVSVTITPRTDARGQSLGLLILSKDITRTRLQEKFRDLLLEVSYTLNSYLSMDEVCSAAVDLISSYMDIPMVFICLAGPEGNALSIGYQKGLGPHFHQHTCSFECGEKYIPKDQLTCFETFSQLTINSGKLSHHAILPCVANQEIAEADYSLVNIPLFGDKGFLGILHLALPTSKKDFLISDSQVLSLLANEISTGIQRKLLEQENRAYAGNLEKMVQQRTEQLRVKDAQLVQSGKLATLGEMATGIAHEINQPLGGINLMTQGLLMAKQRGKLTDEIFDEKLNSILEQIERINKIISHLRTFARQSDENRKEVNLLNPLMDVFKLMGEQLKNRNINLEFQFKKAPSTILADHNRLEQVFLNILSNARDALDTFEAKVNELRKSSDKPTWVDTWCKKVAIRCDETGDWVKIEITDNGGGIPKDILSRIFEPFFTTKEVGKGTGLGLSISYGIVQEFGGTIEVISEEMKGSTFTVCFPVYKTGSDSR